MKLQLENMPAEAWLAAARTRTSRRSFDGMDIDEAVLDGFDESLEELCADGGVRVHLIRSAPETLFKGVVGSYGRISGAPSALAFVTQAADPYGPARMGYLGQAAILEATRLGLDTCWVGGFFNPGRVAKLIEMRAGEEVRAVSPLGHARSKLSSPEKRVYRMKQDHPKPRKTLDDIAPGYPSWPEWARNGVAIARLAPSAYNRQPWRFREEKGSVVVSFESPDTSKTSKRVDCGIAMLNFEVGARHAGAPGRWELLHHANDVAAYSIE